MHRTCFDRTYFGPADYSSLEKEWMRTPAYALGCDKIRIIKTSMSNSKFTDKRFESFVKKQSKKELPYPDNYSANFYDLGIDHFEIWQNKTKIVDHKRTEVQLRKSFKTKPSSIPSGAQLKEIHRFRVDYDTREYDPLEHGGESLESFVKRSVAGNMYRHNLLPVMRAEQKTREKKVEQYYGR